MGHDPRSEPLHDTGRVRPGSNSHAVAAQGGCTMIPLSAGAAQEDETLLLFGFLSQVLSRFARPGSAGTDQAPGDRVMRSAFTIRRW